MPITVRDIAKQVKLSHTMVSRALNPNSKFPIAADKRALIQQTARELGYQPNEAARILATGQSRVIALQIFDMENLHQQRVAQSLAKVLQKDGYDLIVHGYGNDAVRLRWSIDGVFILDRRDCQDFTLNSPNVSIGAFVSHEIDCVYVDLQAGASQAMRHMIHSGRRRIAHVDEDVLLLEDGRTAAYIEAMQESRLPLRQIRIDRDSYEEVYAKVSVALREHDRPDALLCQNDRVAHGCYRAIRDAGLSIGDDVAVVGCDGTEPSKYLEPTLSTIAQPVDAMCAKGWEFLLNRIRDPLMLRQEASLKSHFVLRHSC